MKERKEQQEPKLLLSNKQQKALDEARSEAVEIAEIAGIEITPEIIEIADRMFIAQIIDLENES